MKTELSDADLDSLMKVKSVKELWGVMDATERQEFLTFLQSQGVIISSTETRFSGNK